MYFDHRLFESHQFALMNPLLIERHVVGMWPCEPIVPLELKGQGHLFPCLLRLGEMSIDEKLRALDATVAYGQAHDKEPFSALIGTTAKAGRVRGHLARMMVRRVEGEKMLFRFYDPRVWSCLQWILSASQLDALLGPIDVWTTRDATGDTWTQSQSMQSAESEFAMDLSQLSAVASLGSVNKVLKRLREEEVHVGGSLPLSKRVYTEIENARAAGLVNADDQEAFAFLSMSISPRIHDCPKFQDLIHLARKEPGAYRSLVSEVDEQKIQQYATELEGAWQNG
ncbi:hypothetical protein Xant_20885 [Xanthomonas cissicola]|uniref:DUF4123 domain-containing protein n=2 Tax=Xanthomonas TaxID=338 RepID=A0ABX3M0X5_9XANT|nr:hypothetical protein Xant_20885 [Xanthomonas cissicola]